MQTPIQTPSQEVRIHSAIRAGTQPEDLVHWNQYRVLPRPPLYCELDDRWLDLAGYSAFDDQNGYDISAPEALPSGSQARGPAWFSVANVPREWEEHKRIQDFTAELLASL